MLPVPPVLLPGPSAVEQGWGWKGIFSTLVEELDDPNPPGYELRKPSLSTKRFLICGHAADTHENHICHSELRIPFVVLVGTWSQPKVLKSIASVGRELPKPLDLQDRESFLDSARLRPGTRGSEPYCSAGCLRYRPIISPGGQGHVLLNRCFTPRPLLLLFWLSHRPPF